jgi:large subunit ribosomal protein L9
METMKIILLQDVVNVGKKYEMKNVSDGFARNFLIPRKLAKIATTQTIQEIELTKKQGLKEKEIQQNLLEKNMDSLQDLKISIKEKANEKGHLFASIDSKDINKILKKEHHLEIPSEIIELEKPIKQIGEHKIKVGDKEFTLVVSNQ